MKLQLQTLAACALAFVTASVAVADTRQLAASAGLDAAASSGASLAEVARAKFNNDTGRDDRMAVVIDAGDAGPEARAQLAAAAGVDATEAATMSVTELAVAKFNRDARRDGQITIAETDTGVFASMDVTPEVGRRLTKREAYHAEAIRESANRE